MRKNYIHVIALFIVVFLVVAFKYAAPSAINVALKANAENTGLSIAQLMGRRIPDLGLLNKDDLLFRELDHSIKMKRVEHLAADVLASDNIYQVDFINSDCMCAISLGSFKSKDNQEKVAEYHQSYGYKRAAFTGVKRTNFKVFNEKMANHVFFDMKKHAPKTKGSHLKYQLPIDRKLLAQLINEQQDVTFVKDTAHPHQPSAFGEVYHMVKVDDHVAYIIRILVDLSAASTTYNDAANKTFWIGAGLLGLGFFYPVLSRTFVQTQPALKRPTLSKQPSGKKRSINRLEVFAIVGLAAIVLILSLSNPLSGIGDIIPIDKIKHAMAYAALGFVALYGRKTAKSSFLAVIALLGFSIAVELLQPLFGRSADELDFVANVAGLSIACCALLIIRHFDSPQPAGTPANLDA